MGMSSLSHLRIRNVSSKLLRDALYSVRQELKMLVVALLCVTIVLTILLYLTEHSENAQFSIIDSFVWVFVKYFQDPAKIAQPPATAFGNIIGSLVGVIGSAIIAVTGGLAAKGFSTASAKEEREEELERFHKRMLMSFKIQTNRTLRSYIKENLPEKDAWYSEVKFGYITDSVSAATFELKGMNMKDIYDVCRKYPEFRMRNEAKARSIEEGRHDRFMVEYVPINRRYGCCIDRGSKVTIVSIPSGSMLGTGNFAYYLAAFAGFNYISKDFETALENEALSDNNKSADSAGGGKDELLKEFFDDLENLAHGEDSWVICVMIHVPNSNNSSKDIFLSLSWGKDQEPSAQVYSKLFQTVSDVMTQEERSVGEGNTSAPLVRGRNGLKCNVLNQLRNEGFQGNGLVMSVSAQTTLFNASKRKLQFFLAKSIKDVLSPESLLSDENKEELNNIGKSFSFYGGNKPDNQDELFKKVLELTVEKESDE